MWPLTPHALSVILPFRCTLALPGTGHPMSQLLPLLGHPFPLICSLHLPTPPLSSEMPHSVKSPRSLFAASRKRGTVTHPCGESPRPPQGLVSSSWPLRVVSRFTNGGGPRGSQEKSHSRKELRRLAGGCEMQARSRHLELVTVTASGQGLPAIYIQASSPLLKALISGSRLPCPEKEMQPCSLCSLAP